MKDKLITHFKDLKIAGNTKKNKLCQENNEHQQGNRMPFYKNYMRILKCENLIKRNRLLYRMLDEPNMQNIEHIIKNTQVVNLYFQFPI